MVVRNKETGENKVVVKGIDLYSAEDHIDLQRKIWRGEPTKTYNDALDFNACNVRLNHLLPQRIDRSIALNSPQPRDAFPVADRPTQHNFTDSTAL